MEKIKQIFLTIILSLVLIVSVKAQSVTINQYQYNRWIQVGPTCAGCTSFFVLVVNDLLPRTDGFYYYNIYVWSNSFQSNGYVTNTYIKMINIYAVDIYGKDMFLLNLKYALIPPKSQYFNGSYYLAYVYSSSPNQSVKITWDEISSW